MILGDPKIFAIESGITHAYARLSFLALGFFNIHVGGNRYGVHSPQASLLACSFDEVQERLARRGQHVAPFAADPDAAIIADSVRAAIYGPTAADELLGLDRRAFCDLITSNHLIWAPDGDQAFDDGSHVLQLDLDGRVRLIAFRCVEDNRHKPGTLADIWLSADTYYDILERWLNGFETEWSATPKNSDDTLDSRVRHRDCEDCD